MSEQRLPDEKWRSLFESAGIEFGYRPLAAKANIEYTRARRVLIGLGTSDAAVQAVADALNVSPSRVRELRGEGMATRPFILPDDAGRLNDTERDVVRRVVRALLDARDRTDERTTDTANPPATEQGAPGEAHQDQKTKPADLSERRSRREALPEELPEDAWAARTRDPRFPPEDPDER